jgi:hypothetical protein
MRKRMKAWLAQSCSAVLPNIRFFTEHLALLDRAEAERIAHEIVHELGTGAVTFIDTLSRAMAGGDENSSVDMTTIVQNAELIGSIVQGPVILVHHTGKDAGKGPRGHSSLLGAVDVSLEVVNVSGCRSWTVRKNKDGEDGGVNAFELVPHAVDTDQWGDEVRSCAVRPLLGTPKPPLPPVTGKNKVAVMAALRVVLAASPGRIDWDLAVSTAAAALPATTPSARRNTVAKTTFNSLIGTGHLVVSNGKVCLP